MRKFTQLKGTILSLCFIGAASLAHAQYCTPASENGCVEGDDINSFILDGEGNSINDANTGCSTDGYDDRTSEIVNLAQGITYNATISSEYFTDDPDGDFCAVWIDLNDDNAFDQSEMVGKFGDLDAPTFVSDQGSSVPIAIPADAALGNHRMRVTVAYPILIADEDGNIIDAYPPDSLSSCNDGDQQYGYGETHDYTVNIVDSQVTGIDKIAQDMGLRIYPNPVTGNNINISISQSHPAMNIMITDAFGKTLSNVHYGANAFTTPQEISLEQYASGMYFVHFNGESVHYTAKIIKQ